MFVTTQVPGSKVLGSGSNDMKIQKFAEIQAWQLARELPRRVCQWGFSIPRDESRGYSRSSRTGAADNSPPIHWWEEDLWFSYSPVGTIEINIPNVVFARRINCQDG